MTATPLLAQWVGEYYERGWAVVPLPPRRKSSPPSGLTGRDGIDLTREELLQQLTEDSNIGVRVPDDVIGIDVDAYGEKVGETTLNWLEWGPPGESEQGLGPLPSTYVLTSRDDGVSGIRFYRVPPGREWEQSAGWDIDIIRHAHRYAVAAPSIHPEGRQYRWLSPDGVLCGVPRVADLPELPGEWVRSLEKGARRSSSRAAAVTQDEMRATLEGFRPGPACSCVREWGDRALRAARRELGGAHNALLGPVMNLLRQGAGGCTGAGEALHAAWTAYAGLDPMHSADFAVMVSTTIPKAQADPWECADEAVATLAAMTAVAVTEEEEEEREQEEQEEQDNPYRIINWATFWSRERPATQWLVDGFCQRGQQVVVYSLPGRGKSLMVFEFAVLLSEGLPALGGEAKPPAKVLYVDRENSEQDVDDRLTSMGFGGSVLPNLHYSLLGEWPAMNTPEGGRALHDYVARNGIEVVVIDTTSRVVAGDVFHPGTLTALWEHTQMALKRAGVTVIRIDHAGKVAERGQIGSVMKSADQDLIWRLAWAGGDKVDSNLLEVFCEKDRSNHYKAGDSIVVDRSSTPLRHLLTEMSEPDLADLAVKAAILEKLDELGVARGAGRPTCEKALREAGFGRLPASEEMSRIVAERKSQRR